MTSEPLSADMWGDLEAEARTPGPTMTITKAQYGALREAITRASLDAARAQGRAEALDVDALRRQMEVLADVPHDGDHDACTACRRDGVLAAIKENQP